MENQTWLRVAGHSKNIKDGSTLGWRCYVQGNPVEISLLNWSVSGLASQANYLPGFNADKDERGLLAWIDCYGSFVVKGEVLYVTLAEPPADNPSFKPQA